MNIRYLVAVGLTALLQGGLFAQDPGYKAPEPRRTVQVNQERDDSRESAARINSMEVLDDTRQLRAGDILSLRIVEDRDKVQSLKVQASGDIQAPHIGLVKALGRTPKALAYYMKRELERQYFQTATVIVALETSVADINRPSAAPMSDTFTVYGQVQRQGKYELLADEELTISQAILRAGGFAQFAKKEKVKLIRKSGAKNVTILVNLRDVMERGKLEKDVPMRANDVIIVDERLFNF